MKKQLVGSILTDPIPSLVLRFSLPAVFSSLTTTLYGFLDSLYIGNTIGLNGIAAMNVTLPLTMIITAAALLFGQGGSACQNLFVGNGDRSKADTAAGNMALMLAASGFVISFITLAFTEALLRAFGATTDILPLSLAYTRIRAIGFPFAIFSAGAVSLVRNDGKPYFAMICSLSGAVIKMIADPIAMYVFHWGITGLAWISTGVQIISALVTVYFLVVKSSYHWRFAHFKPDLKIIGRIIRLGIEPTINQLAMTVVQILVNQGLKRYGALSQYGSEIPLALVGSLGYILEMCRGIVAGVSQGTQPIIGQNYGAARFVRVKHALKVSMIFSGIVMIAVSGITIVFAQNVVGWFGDKTETALDFGVTYIRMVFPTMMLLPFTTMISSFFTTIGDVRKGLTLTFVRQAVLLLPLILLLPKQMGIKGILLAYPVTDAIICGIAVCTLRRFWRKKSMETPT